MTLSSRNFLPHTGQASPSSLLLLTHASALSLRTWPQVFKAEKGYLVHGSAVTGQTYGGAALMPLAIGTREAHDPELLPTSAAEEAAAEASGSPFEGRIWTGNTSLRLWMLSYMPGAVRRLSIRKKGQRKQFNSLKFLDIWEPSHINQVLGTPNAK